MANVIHLHCRHCGEPLDNRDEAYCPPCNLYLAYRAMPFLLGMILTGHLATDLAGRYPQGLPAIGSDPFGDEEDVALDETAQVWE
jgi:hypothetical protein